MKNGYSYARSFGRGSKYALLIAGLFIGAFAQGQDVLDRFNRGNTISIGGTPTWGGSETATDGLTVSNNELLLQVPNGGGNGVEYATQSSPGDFNTTLNQNTCTMTWAFNMRQNRTDPGGFASGAYGVAVVLAGSATDLTTGTGYAVVLGQPTGGGNDFLRLVRYNGGLDADGNLTDIITGTADLATEYLDVRVTYVPSTNTWSMFFRNNGIAGPWGDPLTASTSVAASAVNGTYTGTNLPVMGCYWNHAGTDFEFARIDNFYMPGGAPTVPVMTPTSATICSGGPGASLSAAASSTTTTRVTINSTGGPSNLGTGAANNGSVYPFTLTASGIPTSGVVVESVQINGVTHTNPDDLDILLQSPTGTNVVLMSDVGGGTDIAGNSYTIMDDAVSFADGAVNPSGMYDPTNSGASDDYPTSPGPGNGFSQANPTLTSFTGNFVGTWNLLIRDDNTGEGGAITSWSITFTYTSTVSYTWSPATGLSGTSGVPVTANPASTQIYTVTAAHTGNGCTSSNTVTVTVAGTPTASNAGPDQSVCTFATLAANNPGTGVGAWTVVSGPSTAIGQFANPAVRNTTFTPAGGGGAYTLRWTITNAPCTASTDDVIITSGIPTTSAAGPNQTACSTGATLAANAPSIGTGAWSVVTFPGGGSNSLAQFSSSTSPTATFTPSPAVAGNYTLRWTISNAPCTASPDDVVVTIVLTPTTSAAGPDQNVCTSATLAANNPSAGVGAWTVVSGPSTAIGQFANPAVRNTTFTPAGGGGAYTLRWTITNAPCTASTDDVIINSGIPTVSAAGPDQSTCANVAVTLAANSPTIGTGAWSVVSGPSTLLSQFSSTASPTATFTPAVFTVGTYVLRWTISNAPCTASTDDVSITTVGLPTAPTMTPTSASICSGGPVGLSASSPNVSGTFTGAAITLGQNTTATPYPSPLVISGLPTSGVTVTSVAINGITHSQPDDIDMVLRSPTGTYVVLMSDVGGNPTITGVNYVIQDGGTAFADNSTNASGTYGPTNSGATDNFPAPVGSLTQGTPAISNFTGNFNGTWNLYIDGDANGGSGSLASWSITFNSVVTYSWSPATGLSATTGASVTCTATSSQTYTATVTNPFTGCTNSNTVAVTVASTPTTATVGGAQTICASGTTTGLGGNTPGVGTGAWSVIGGGTGNFTPNASTPNATFTHTGGTVTAVRWTISNSPCTASTADVSITINAAPTTATVGGAQTICELGTTTGLGGNTPGVGTGAWSIIGGGTGNFTPNASTPNATFTHTGGTVTAVRWTISNSPCTASTADVSITINAAPTASAAGGDQSVCTQPGSATMAANAPGVGTGAWSQVSGPVSATITTPGSPATTITGMTTAGNYVFRWTISNAPCTASQDDVTVTTAACSYFSRATGNVSDPIWSDTPSGPAGPATFTSSTSMTVQSPDVVTNTTNTQVNALTIDAGGTLILGGATSFATNGNSLLVNGTLTANDNSLMLLNSTVASTATFAALTSFWDLSVDADVSCTVTGSVHIRGSLDLLDGVFNASGASVSLRSTATYTGRLGPVDPGASYTGLLNVERYIPAGATDWRLLGSPVAGRWVGNWQDDFITAGFPGSTVPWFDNPVGSGILWPSIRWYDEPNTGSGQNDGMQGVSNNLQGLSVGKGFACWAGDNLFTTAAFVTDLRGTPTIANTPVSLPVTWTNTGTPAVDGWNLVSNPVPSPIAFDQLYAGSTNIEDYVTYYNPANGNTAVWDISLGVGTNGATNTIQSSQGFFLKANGAAPSVSVVEADKVSSNGGGLFGGDVDEVPAQLHLGLTSGLNTFTDETVIVFHAGTPVLDADDVLKYVFSNDGSPQVATMAAGGEQIAINAYGEFTSALSIPVSVNVAVDGTYTLALTTAGDLPLTCITLEDTEMGSFMVMNDGATYSFDILANADATVARFILHASAPIAFSSANALCGANPDGHASVNIAAGTADVVWTDDLNNQLLAQAGVTGEAAITDLGPGAYVVHVSTNTACGELVHGFTIEAPFVLEGLATATNATCVDTEDGAVDLIPMGGVAPYVFNWDDANTSTTEDLEAVLPGTYSVTITDGNGCTWTSGGYVVDHAGPDATISVASTSVVVNTPLVLQGVDANATYAWDFGDGSGATDMMVEHAWTLPGTYTVTLTVSNASCTTTNTVEITVELNTGLGGANANIVNHVWATMQSIIVEHGFKSTDPLFIEVLDATGRLQAQRKVAAMPGRVSLPSEGLSTGVWFVRLTCGDAQETFRVPLMR